jgi:hypothetical protein
MRSSIQQSKSGALLQILTLGAIVAAFVVNALSNLFPLNGESIGELSNTLFRAVQIIPANYAFSIWGIIYLGLFAYGIYQASPERGGDRLLQSINVPLIVSSLAQIVWVLLFLSRQFWWSVLAMAAILIPLILIYQRLWANRGSLTRRERWLVRIPLTIYLAWIAVATIVNVAIALYNSGWNGFGLSDNGWTVIMLMVGAAIASILALQRADIPFVAVFVWAFVAIAVRQFDQWGIVAVAIACSLVMAVCLVLAERRRQIEAET